MNIRIEKHGETESGVFWIQVHVGELTVLGRGLVSGSFESFKRNFKFVFLSDQSCEKLQAIDDKTRSDLRQAVKRAWMSTKQPRVDCVRLETHEIVLK